jgi:hypothetical protein
MAVKRTKKSKRGRRRLLQAVKGGTLRLRKEPQTAAEPHVEANNHHPGVLRLDSEEWRLPEALVEAGEPESKGIMPGRVMSTISILAIIFIAIMAWFVSQMPGK